MKPGGAGFQHDNWSWGLLVRYPWALKWSSQGLSLSLVERWEHDHGSKAVEDAVCGVPLVHTRLRGWSF